VILAYVGIVRNKRREKEAAEEGNVECSKTKLLKMFTCH
jgi:hypothetical protein